jgi:CDP-diacylglycerol--serine O-phosphatidyltransferase
MSTQRVSSRPPVVDAARLLLPNIVTLMALACGLTAVRVATTGRIGAVLLLMAAAAILDGLDGRIARLLDATSEMGAQMDSLCDAIGFGVAPALITYFLVLRDAGGHPFRHAVGLWLTLIWAAAIIYIACIVLRLARFNTLLADPLPAAFQKEFFVGIPAPAAAWLALVPVVLRGAFHVGWWTHPLFGSLWLIFMGVLAFSKLPTFTFKTLQLQVPQVLGLLVFAVVLIAVAVSFPYLAIALVLVAYLGHIPFAIRAHRWLTQHPEEWNHNSRERAELARQRRDKRNQARRLRRQLHSGF